MKFTQWELKRLKKGQAIKQRRNHCNAARWKHNQLLSSPEPQETNNTNILSRPVLRQHILQLYKSAFTTCGSGFCAWNTG